MDYIFRWMGAKFLGPEYAVGEAGDAPKLRVTEADPQQASIVQSSGDGRPGMFRVRRPDDAQRVVLQV